MNPIAFRDLLKIKVKTGLIRVIFLAYGSSFIAKDAEHSIQNHIISNVKGAVDEITKPVTIHLPFGGKSGVNFGQGLNLV